MGLILLTYPGHNKTLFSCIKQSFIETDQQTKHTEHHVTSYMRTKAVLAWVQQGNIFIHHHLKHLVKTIVEIK